MMKKAIARRVPKKKRKKYFSLLLLLPTPQGNFLLERHSLFYEIIITEAKVKSSFKILYE